MKTIILAALVAISCITATVGIANAGDDLAVHGYEGLRYGR